MVELFDATTLFISVLVLDTFLSSVVEPLVREVTTVSSSSSVLVFSFFSAGGLSPSPDEELLLLVVTRGCSGPVGPVSFFLFLCKNEEKNNTPATGIISMLVSTLF